MFEVQGSKFKVQSYWAVMLACLMWPVAARSQDVAEEEKEPGEKKVIVSATRTEIPYTDSSSSATVLFEGDLEAMATPFVADALRGVPGLDVRRGGPWGQTTSLYLRGTNDNHVKYMLDGIDVTDPSTPTATPFLDHLMMPGAGRIEVIRGPQSTLYGSDAIGGVVNIITRAPRSSEPRLGYEVEGGSFGTSRQRLTAEIAGEKVGAFVAMSRLESAGISASSAGSERDPYRNTALTTRFSVTPTETFGADIVLHAIEAQTEFDDSDADNLFNETDSEQVFFKVEPRAHLMDGRWVSSLNLNLGHTERDTRIFGFGSFTDLLFKGRAYEADWQNDVQLADWNLLTAGVAHREERAESGISSSFGESEDEQSRRLTSVYVSDQVRLMGGRVQIVPGVRRDEYSDFGGQTTWRVASSYRHTETGTTLRGSFGTGFNAPSLFQLFDPFSGDTSLSAERSEGWDAGVEQAFTMIGGGPATVGITYFENDIQDLIDFSFVTFKYFQAGSARTRGVEFFAAWEPCEFVTLRPSYTYTDTEGTDGQRLLRRPLHKGGVDAVTRFWNERAELALGVFYVGERDDADPTTLATVTNEDYVVVRLAASIRVHDNVELIGRVENALDERYEDVLGFTSPGVAAYGGVRITLP